MNNQQPTVALVVQHCFLNPYMACEVSCSCFHAFFDPSGPQCCYCSSWARRGVAMPRSEVLTGARLSITKTASRTRCDGILARAICGVCLSRGAATGGGDDDHYGFLGGGCIDVA